jgi:hypothetical protein
MLNFYPMLPNCYQIVFLCKNIYIFVKQTRKTLHHEKIYNDCRSIPQEFFCTKHKTTIRSSRLKQLTIMKWKVQQQGHYLNGKLQGEWIL